MRDVNRRDLAAYAAAAAGIAGAAATPRPAAAAESLTGTKALDGAIGAYLALPGKKSFRVSARTGPQSRLLLDRDPAARLFLASAYKTFILARYLRDVDLGYITEAEGVAIDDSVRNVGSPVFLDLAGKTPAFAVLEAMMSHSDNMATDAATRKVGIARVRTLVASAGLDSIRIPDSTRRLASYLFGAPYGVDIGWSGIQAVLAGHLPGKPRPAVNERETIVGNAVDLVSWYEQALSGAFFLKPATLAEFKRIHATSVQIPDILPQGSVAYAKGGEVEDLFGFSAKSMAGQTIVAGRTPITFCFLLNWQTRDGGFAEVQARYFAAVAGILAEVARLVA